MQPYPVEVGKNFSPSPEENLFDTMFKQYERVIIESLITSFGLDFIVQDRYGEDVDTVHNVRKIGIDSQMTYKNHANQEAYENRGAYSSKTYHADQRYRDVMQEAKHDFETNGTLIKDSYVEGNTLFTRSNPTIPRERQGQLDHVVPAEKIHNDRGRVLAGLDGPALANNRDNLRYTNAALNRNMSNMTVEDYIAWCEKNPAQVNWNGNPGEPLPESVKEKLRSEYQRAKKAQDDRIARSYYTSPRFAKDLGKAVANVGVRMGARQVFGFIFAEIWFSVKEELERVEEPFSMEDRLNSIGEGIRRGVKNAKEKYKDLIARFGEGLVSGALASLTTTLCNIFFTTAKNTVRIIRQSWASLVKAAEIILFNPDDLLFGDRICAATKILAVGGSVIAGTTVSDLLSKTPVGALPVVGDIIQTFCGALVSGIMSCTLLCLLDRSQIMRQLVNRFNDVPTMSTSIHYFREQARYFEAYAAELEQIDLEEFQKECGAYEEISAGIDKVSDENQLNVFLRKVFDEYHIPLPWQGDFDTFMSNKENHLVFR